MSTDKPASSIKRSITIASVIMMTSVLLSRVLGIVREMVLAGYGGTRSEMDAYVAAFLLPEIVNHLLAGGFMSVTFIPIFQKYMAQGRRDLGWRACSNLLTTGTVVIAGVIGVCLVFTEELLGLMGKHIADPAQLALTVRMTRIILPAQIFFYWGALLMAVQYADKRFFVPALAPLLYNVGIIAGGVALAPVVGIEGFAWGVLAGSVGGNFLVQAYGARASGMSFRFRIDLGDSDLKKYVLVTIPLVLGLGMQFSNEVFFRYFGSFLGEGALASLNYSLRTMMALVAVFGQAFGIAAFPFLSQYVAEKRYREMNALLFSIVGKVGMLVVPFSMLMMVLSKETLALLFQRGKFTEASTLVTAPVLVMYCIGAFGMAATNMVSRGFYALQNTVLPMVVSSVLAICSIPLYWICLHRSGAPGIALVGSLSMIAQFVVMTALWTKRYEGGRELRELVVRLAKIVGISGVGCAVCYGVARWTGGLPSVQGLGATWRSLVILVASGTPAVLVIFGAFHQLGIADLRSTANVLLRRRSGRSEPVAAMK